MPLDFRAAFESLADLVVVVDWQRRYVYANPAALTALRKTMAEIEGKDFREVFPATRGGPLDQCLERLQAGEPHARIVGHSPIADRWYEYSASPSGDHVVALMRDVSDAVEARGLLDRHEERQRSLVEA